MLIKKAMDIKISEVTPKKLYLNRRQFLMSSSALAGISLLNPGSLRSSVLQSERKLMISIRGEYKVAESLTAFEEASEYTNYYEFSTGKRSVKKLSEGLKTSPWKITVDGEVDKSLEFDVKELTQKFPLEERIYRWRCVEAWSMVIPWIGFSLKEFIKLCAPNSRARFVEFTTLLDADQMPGVKSKVLPWPYREALRMDEALHPLTMMVVGMYDEILPNQNGAPLRLVVPWKYGFKSAKSIVRIRFTEKMSRSAWNRTKPEEYGFYANVNPEVDHPRWSQASERRIGEEGRRPTLMFNGYADQVAGLYTGMDLGKYF
ncbi:MAG: protein-methionine-sulfoxide reductase catalytic subunit MsrP [Candidatus Aminicenantaceae bacterium]